MSRVLFAWELGANLGHLARDLPLARRCRQEGLDVAFAVPDLRLAGAVLDGEGFTLLQAPRMHSPIRRTTPPINYADLLLHAGYDDVHTLSGAIHGWSGLIALSGAALMLYDHAPTALLAARLIDLPVMLVGNGFEIPTTRGELPSLLPWLDIPARLFADVETLVLSHINRILDHRGSPRLDQLTAMFRGTTPLLTTFAELDHFGPRDDVRYVGPVHALPSLPAITWTARRPAMRIFAYLHPGAPGCENLLSALNALGGETICAIPGLPVEWRMRFGNLKLYAHAVDLERLLPQADLVITCGSGTIASALLAGVPAVVLPQVGEQYLAGLRLQELGAGRQLRQGGAVDEYAGAVSDVLADVCLRSQAQAFAAKYAGFSQEAAADAQWHAMTRLLGSTRCD